MDDHIQLIKNVHKEFHDSLLRVGKLPMRDTGIGFWSVSHPDEIISIFKKISLDKKKNLLDLGSGDGLVVHLASLFTKATGIEADPYLFEVSKNLQKKLSSIPSVKDAVHICGDFMSHAIGDYDIIFVAPDKPFFRGLDKKLQKELRGHLIVYGHHFHPNNLDVVASFNVNGSKVSIYTNKNS